MIEDDSKHFIGKVAQKAILECNGQILVCRGINENLWEFPGGRLNNDGSPQENLKREIQEELGIVIDVAHPFHVSYSIHVQSNTKRIFIAYHSIVDDNVFVLDADELSEAKWIMPEDLVLLEMFDDSREASDQFLKFKNFA